MSDRDFNQDANTSTGGAGASSGLAGTGATDAGTTRDTSLATGGGGLSTGAAAGAGGGAAVGVASQAKEYGQRVAEAATQARDYVTERASAIGTTVGDKFRDLQNVDYRQAAEDAKEYARQKPGQALLISAAAGFVLGLLLRGSRR